MLFAIVLATFVSTLIGGSFALRFRDKLHLILGFSAGAVLGVAFFDLLPESIILGQKFFQPAFLTQFVALGFIIYLVLDRTIFFHSHNESEVETATLSRGMLGAGSLSIHSFLDGMAIGLSFQVSVATGLVVAMAVLVHDFSDGINTVNMILKNHGEKSRAFNWLIVDAAAPVVGAVSTMFFSMPERYLSIILAVFTGFFLYIGASDLVPESHHAHPKLLTTVMTILGFLVLFLVIRLANF